MPFYIEIEVINNMILNYFWVKGYTYKGVVQLLENKDNENRKQKNIWHSIKQL